MCVFQESFCLKTENMGDLIFFLRNIKAKKKRVFYSAVTCIKLEIVVVGYPWTDGMLNQLQQCL